MKDYESISEIIDVDTGETRIPLREWTLVVLQHGIEKNLGDIGGREEFVANSRVLVTEEDGRQWVGHTRLG